MIDRVFNILEKAPVLSIVLTFVFLIFTAYTFRNTIVAYVKKKYNLFSEEEIRTAININQPLYIKNTKNEDFYNPSYFDYEDKVITALKEARNG